MQEFNNAIENIADAVENLNLDPKNDFGYTVGDQLHEMCWQLERIADALEKLTAK
jgi:hypothetical protein